MIVEAMKQWREVLAREEYRLRQTGQSQVYSGVGFVITSIDQAIADLEKQEPVLVVEKESDYMSGGHFHTGTKPHIDPTKVWSLPIGTKLYPHPQPKDKNDD